MTRPLTPPQTPFSAAQKSHPVTPRRGKPVDAGIAPQATVRKHLGLDNNSDMLVCQLEDFLKDYGPSESAAKLDPDVDTCFEEVVSRGLAEAREGGLYHWAKYKTTPKSTVKARETSVSVEQVDCNPSGLKETETRTFEPLQAIVNCVLEFVKKGNPQNTGLHFNLVPFKKLSSDIAGSNHKIDGCFIAEPLDVKETMVANRNINVPMEFKTKRNSKDRAIVHLQILGACHHILNEDVRRMWIYGLTLEDHLCSLWYFSRSHSVKSKAFDWIEDPKSFVRILLAFAKATPRELGIDPTVHLVLEGANKAASFVYEVPVKENVNDKIRYYKTLNIISESRPMVIASRTTRVWKVVEVTDASGKKVVDSSEEMVLKDVWLSEDRDTEGQNLDAIFAAVDKYVDTGLEAQRLKDPTGNDEQLLTQLIREDPRFRSFDQISVNRLVANLTNKAYRDLFLTKVHDWQGETCKDLGKNVWRDEEFFSTSSLVDLMKDDPNLTEIPDPELTASNNIKSTKSGDPKSTPRMPTFHDATVPKWGDKQRDEFDAANRPRSFAPKRQSRFIYREMCTTLQNLGTVGQVVDVLCQTMDAMHILFLAGWVHRDISSNNIMAYRSNPDGRWVVKLADLEFSRLMVDPTRQGNVDPRTGTAYFIPVEVLNKGYLLDNFRQTSPFDKSSLFDKSNPSDGSHLLPEMASSQSFSLPSFSKRPPVTQRNLAVQLNASTIGQEYVDNLKHYRAFPDEATMLDMDLEPRWTDVPEDSAVVNHNYQHDLESIWWILLWIITCRIRHGPSALRMGRYFDPNMKNSEARSRLFEQGLAADKVNLLEGIRPLWPVVDALRKGMYAASLMRAVFGHLNVAEAYSSIQADFSQSLRFLHHLGGKWRDIALQRSSTSPTQPSTAITQDTSTNTGKRPHEGTVEDPSTENRSASKRICK